LIVSAIRSGAKIQIEPRDGFIGVPNPFLHCAAAIKFAEREPTEAFWRGT